jgi:rod shape determining protein RodA
VRGRSASFAPSRVFALRGVRWVEVDWLVLVITFALLGIGLLFVQGISDSTSNEITRDVSFEAHRQKVFLTLPLLLAGLLVRPSWLRRNAVWLYLGCMALLVAVYFIGEERNNAQRWIQLPRFDLQPSELAKVGVILMLARVLAENRLESLGDWLKPLAVVLVPMALVAGQPDLGTAMTLVPVSLGLLHLAGARWGALLGFVAAGIGVGWLAVEAELVRDYQLERVETWAESYDAEGLIARRTGAGFHQYHNRVTAGNGGVFGRGVGSGVANETGLLPERESDSIFMVIAEEVGFVGALGVLALYGLLVTLMMVSAAGIRDRFARLVVGGVALYFAAHLVINVSVNIGLLPMTGLTLPLFSTGGSSLLATFLALGLAVGMGANHETGLDRDAFRSY